MDVAAMADRISSAASAVAEAPAADATPAPEPTPAPAPEPADASPAPADAPTEAIDFDDEPEPLNFDEPEPEPAAQPQQAQPQQTATDAEAQEIAKVLQAGGIPKQVENAFMKTNRGRNLLALYKSERILRESPQFDENGNNTGGLGFMPTPEQIKDYHHSASDWHAATHEFAANPSSWAVNWFGPDGQGQFRDGTQQVLESIPQVIDQAFNHAVNTGNRQLEEQAIAHYGAIFKPMLSSYLDGLYNRANSIQDPAQREQYLNAARAIEHDVFGKFRGDEQLQQAKQPDPLAEREAALAERERRLNAWQSRSATEAQKQAENEIFTSIDQNLNHDIEKALVSVKDGLSPRAYRAAVADFKREIQDAVRKNTIGWRDFNFALSAARTSRGADARQAPVHTYQRFARQAIQARYRTVLQELTNDAGRQNGAAHATAAASAAHRAPNTAGGQPPPQSVIPTNKIVRKPGEDRTDFMARRIAGALGSSSPN